MHNKKNVFYQWRGTGYGVLKLATLHQSLRNSILRSHAHVVIVVVVVVVVEVVVVVVVVVEVVVVDKTFINTNVPNCTELQARQKSIKRQAEIILSGHFHHSCFELA